MGVEISGGERDQRSYALRSRAVNGKRQAAPDAARRACRSGPDARQDLRRLLAVALRRLGQLAAQRILDDARHVVGQPLAQHRPQQLGGGAVHLGRRAGHARASAVSALRTLRRMASATAFLARDAADEGGAGVNTTARPAAAARDRRRRRAGLPPGAEPASAVAATGASAAAACRSAGGDGRLGLATSCPTSLAQACGLSGFAAGLGGLAHRTRERRHVSRGAAVQTERSASAARAALPAVALLSLLSGSALGAARCPPWGRLGLGRDGATWRTAPRAAAPRCRSRTTASSRLSVRRRGPCSVRHSGKFGRRGPPVSHPGRAAGVGARAECRRLRIRRIGIRVRGPFSRTLAISCCRESALIGQRGRRP